MFDEDFLISVLLSGIAFKSFYGFDYDVTLQWRCPWFILEPRTKRDTKAIWAGRKMAWSSLQSGKNVYGKKKFWKLVAPCCNNGHKTVSVYVSSNTTINKAAIKRYRSAPQSKCKNMWPSHRSRLLPSAKAKSYLLPEVLNTAVLAQCPPSRLTLLRRYRGKLMCGQTAGVRAVDHSQAADVFMAVFPNEKWTSLVLLDKEKTFCTKRLLLEF